MARRRLEAVAQSTSISFVAKMMRYLSCIEMLATPFLRFLEMAASVLSLSFHRI